MRTRVSALVVVVLASTVAAVESQSPVRQVPTPEPPAATSRSPGKSLYERLGGAYPIAVVVDDFIERLLVNDTLNANPAIKAARGRVPKDSNSTSPRSCVRSRVDPVGTSAAR